MKTIREVLAAKGSGVWTIGPKDSVFDALKLMAEKEVGALLVAEGEKILGMFSERDYARKVILKGLSSPLTSVEAVMTTRVVYAQPDQTIEEAMALMTEKRIRHLPVLENDNLVGVMSIGDVVKAAIAEREFMIGQLENYIATG